MPLACIELTSFDYDGYVKACALFSTVWYVWKPLGGEFRVDKYIPLSQSRDDQLKLASVYAWARRTDPDYSIRFLNMKREWHEGQVERQSCNYFVKPAC